MYISSVGRRAVPALAAAGVAAMAVLALAAPAGASTGTSELSPEQAGYTATGAQFKTITARVYLRNPMQYAGEVASYGHSVQLWSSGLTVTLGVTASTSAAVPRYGVFATIYDRSTHQVIASNPDAVLCEPSGDCHAGDLVLDNPGFTWTMRISYSPVDGQLVMSGEGLNGLWTFHSSYTAAAQSFTEARVGTEFGSTPWDGSYSYTPPKQPVKAAVYSDVSLTSYSGHTATLWSWWVHHHLLANTEQQSGSDWVAVPTDLTAGGASFQTWFVPQSGQGPEQPARS